MAYFIFSVLGADAGQVSRFLQARMWGVDEVETHRDMLAPGDHALIYLAAPEHLFIGRAELASAVHPWTPEEAQGYHGRSPSGVVLNRFEVWDPPVPMRAVLAQIDRSAGARADFESGVIAITVGEYEAALSVAGRGAHQTD